MSRLVHVARDSAAGIATSVSGAPRATLAVVLVITLALGSLLPQLSLVNSEEMWIPEGPRADAYHALAASMGSTEYVGVLARPTDGNIVGAAEFEALLELEDAAVSNSSVAEAFRFPRDPGANALSIADIVAQADAILSHRAEVFEPLAAALAESVAGSSGAAADEAVLQAAAAVALLTAVRVVGAEQGGDGDALLRALLPELEVALLSGTGHASKADATAALLAAVDFANWSKESGPLVPSDAALAAARSLVAEASAHLTSNASAPTKAAAAAIVSESFLVVRHVIALQGADPAGTSALLAHLSAGIGSGGAPAALADYANATSALLHDVLFVDRLEPFADGEAAYGIRAMAIELSAILGSNATLALKAGGVSLFARLFEAVGSMGESGLDLAVPQTNVSYESFSVALNENATVLGDIAGTQAARAAAAANLSLRTTAFLGNLINLNLTGIFTDQVSFQRVLTMVTFLNDTFAELEVLLSLPDDPLLSGHAAVMVAREVLNVVNTSAVLPHVVDLNASARLSHSLRLLEAAVRAHGTEPGADAFGRAAGLLLSTADFEAASLLPSSAEEVLLLTADTLAASSAVLVGGDPVSIKASFAACAAAAFSQGAAAPASDLAPAAHATFVSVLQREFAALEGLLSSGQNPALFARLARASLAVFSEGLAAPEGGLAGTDARFVDPLRAILEPLPAILRSATVPNATKDLVVAQAFLGADTASSHIVRVPAPGVPRDRAESAERIRSLGDAGVVRTLAVLLNTTRTLRPELAALPPGDPRFQAFSDAVAAYHPAAEDETRAVLGFRARTLLPNALAFSGGSIAAEGTVVLFLFNGSLDRPTLGARENALRDLARAQQPSTVAYTAFGYGLMWVDTQRAMDLSVVLFSLTMLAVMGAALWAVYRDAFDVLLTLALLGCTVLWVLGTAALLGIAINPVTQVLPVLLIGLAEDYAVHITIGYRRRRQEGAHARAAALASVLGVGGVLFVATVTNGLSFLSFGGSDLDVIRDFGTLMALGLAYSFVLTITLIPAATVWRDLRRDRQAAERAEPPAPAEARAPEAPRAGRAERGLLRAVQVCVRHPWSALAVVALLTAASGIGATTLATTFSYDQITARDLEAVSTLNAAQDGYGASIQRVFIVIEGRVDDPAVFLAIGEAAALAADDPFVVRAQGAAGVASIASYMDELAARIRLEGTSAHGYSSAFSTAFRDADRTGDGRLSAADNLTQPQVAALYDALLDAPRQTATEFVHRGPQGYERAAIRVEAVRAVEHGDALAAALHADSAPLRATALAADVTGVTVTGLPLLNREVMQAVQDSGWQSVLATIVAALLILTVFFFAAFRSMALGSLTIAPTLIAVLWTLGAMALAGLSLNMMTVMIATTTVGMGDLYAIHISYAFYRELRRRETAELAATAMVREAGLPLLEASVTTALGFLILVLAPVPIVQSYGLIFALSIVFAFLYSILVMPALVLLLARATHKIGSEIPA